MKLKLTNLTELQDSIGGAVVASCEGSCMGKGAAELVVIPCRGSLKPWVAGGGRADPGLGGVAAGRRI
jgi:hypothetical protein